MFKTLFRDRFLILLLLLAVAIKIFSLNSGWVEDGYSTGVYPILSKIFRALLGWVPFSVGDVAYIAAFVWLVMKTWKLLMLLKRRRAKGHLSWMLFRKYVKLALLIYVVFNLCWGLNYNRQGIAGQLGLRLAAYNTDDLYTLVRVLQTRLTLSAGKVDSVQRCRYDANRFLFAAGTEAYRSSASRFPFLAFSPSSIKPSLLTPVGQWFGFTGYYNPFTAEAQLKTDVPVFLKPFVTTHEMAHQVGYAKENEANFAAFLVCKASENPDFLYSAYFDLYRDAVSEYMPYSTREEIERMRTEVPQRVRLDIGELRLYSLRNRNFIEPWMSGAYDSYLRLNSQPKGKATYNEVIAYLIAYMKKYGVDAI